MKKLLLPTFLILAVSSTFAQMLPIFKIDTTHLDGITTGRKQKMIKALTCLEKIMNDTSFQQELLTLHFEYDVSNDPNRNLSTLEVVKKIYAGKEWYTQAEDNTANVHWTIVKKHKPFLARHPALGFGWPTDTTIFTYTWFFDDENRMDEVVGHIAHEWSHKLGFDHLFDDHPGRENTVPYAFGDLVRKYAKKCI